MEKDQKTERATPKKRRDERKRGNVFSSRDVVNLVSILAVFFFFSVYFPVMLEKISEFVFRFMGYMKSGVRITEEFARVIITDLAVALVYTVVVPAAVAILAAVIGTGVQTRFNFSAEALKPKFSRLNPLQGIKRMFSMRSLVELLKSTVKIIIIIAAIYNFFQSSLLSFSNTLEMEPEVSAAMLLDMVMSLVFNVCIIFIFVAAADFLFQWWSHEKDLRMSKQEVKEEYKQVEGDPQVKGKIKQQQRKMAMSRMMQQVPTADVVIRNPTHFAVALRYHIDADNAPLVVAKGQDELAARIVRTAEQHGVYVTEEVELTRAIYAAADIGEEIPLEHYRAVAELLAMIYQLKEIKLRA